MSLKKVNILYTEGNFEYYLREDNKIVSQIKDLCKDYRRNEQLPEVATELDKVRSYNTSYPTKNVIDAVLSYQNENVKKAVNYIRYRYLGTCSYLDVFGEKAQKEYEQSAHFQQNKRMEEKIEDVSSQVDDLKQQLIDMQQLMFNMAKTLNTTKSAINKYRAG